jgi:hypothetical protein
MHPFAPVEKYVSRDAADGKLESLVEAARRATAA